MKISVTSLSPRDSFGMIHVSLEILMKRGDTTDGGTIDVFIPATDSLSKARNMAVERLRQLAQDILDADPVESIDEVSEYLDVQKAVDKFFESQSLTRDETPET